MKADAETLILWGVGGIYSVTIGLLLIFLTAYLIFRRKSKYDVYLEKIPHPSWIPILGTAHHLVMCEKHGIMLDYSNTIFHAKIYC